LHRLGGEGGNVLGADRQDFILERARGAKPEGLRRFALPGLAVPIRIHDVAEAFVDRIAVRMHVRHAAHGARGDGRAVIGVLARDDDAPLGFAFEHPIMPDQADRGVVRFRARRAVENLIEIAGSELGKLARQGDDRGVRRLEEGIVERKLDHLVVSRLRERLAPIADVAGPQSRHAVENALAFAVPDIGAVAAHDDARAGRP
jgi:hypothetical protein